MKGVLSYLTKRFSSTVSKAAATASEAPKKPKFRGMFKFDDYHQIKFEKHWRNRIIEREAENLKTWKKMVGGSSEASSSSNWATIWKRDISKRSDPGKESYPELYGEYFYTQHAVNQDGKVYYVFIRTHAKTNKEEVVLDLRKVPQIIDPADVILDKIKISDDHNRIAFNVDIHNNERLSLGVIDVKSGEVIDWIDNCSQAEFDKTGEYIYYVEADELNRPFQIRKRKVGSQSEQDNDPILLTDDDKTQGSNNFIYLFLINLIILISEFQKTKDI